MKIITTGITKPPRMVIYGEHKIGKSTFASGFPNPIFIQTEDGLESLGVEAFEKCTNIVDVFKCLHYLVENDHQYKTLGLDSLDWTEKLIFEAICENEHVKHIGEIAYGGGYKLAINYWRQLITLLDTLNSKKKMYIVLLAHSKVTKFEDPERENYDKYSLDLHDKAAKLIYEYVDIIGFATFKVATIEKKEGFGTTIKAKSTGERVLNLAPRAAFEAGNRYSLPECLPLSFQSLQEELRKSLPQKKEGNLSKIKEEREKKKEVENA